MGKAAHERVGGVYTIVSPISVTSIALVALDDETYLVQGKA